MAFGLLSLAFVADRLAAQCGATIDLGRGPIAVHLPPTYSADPASPSPLVVALHGYGGSGVLMEDSIGFLPLSEDYGFIYVTPDGTVDEDGFQFWNASPVCCNLFGSQIDDSRYLRDLIDTIVDRCNVDRGRIYLIGHSNGGYMSYRMACDHGDTITALVSWAGVTTFDPAECDSFKPMHVLQMHGTADEIWLYDGGRFRGRSYRGAPETIAIWAEHNGCSAGLEMLPDFFDVDTTLQGADTTVMRTSGDCRPGGSAELWTILAAGHEMHPTEFARRRLVESLLSHRLTCRGNERITRASCGKRRRLTLRLAGGLADEAFEVRLSTGESVRGVLDRKGRRKIRFRDLPRGGGRAEVSWGCSTRGSVRYSCP